MEQYTPLMKAVIELEDFLIKAKRMPIGTVSKGRKKIAEGKWVKVKGEIKKVQEKPKDQTETPEFKKWFGNSKVVDENGKPLVVYHGTDKVFTEFKEDLLGGNTSAPSAKKGFFFTTNPKVAGYYPAYTEEQLSNLYYDIFGGKPIYEKLYIPKLNDITEIEKKDNEYIVHYKDNKNREKREHLYGDKLNEKEILMKLQKKISQYSEKTGETLVKLDIKKEIEKYRKYENEIEDYMYENLSRKDKKIINLKIYNQYIDLESKDEIDKDYENIKKNNPLLSEIISKMDIVKGNINIAKEYENLKKFSERKHSGGNEDSYWEGEEDINLTPNIMPVFLKIKNPLIHDFYGEPYRDESYNDLIEEAKSKGNDGLYLKNTFDPYQTDIWIAFSPTQIKSATGNKGTFDPNNPDMTKARI